MLKMLRAKMMGQNQARFSSAIGEILTRTCRSVASSQLQLNCHIRLKQPHSHFYVQSDKSIRLKTINGRAGTELLRARMLPLGHSMEKNTTILPNLTKATFQVHAIAEHESVVARRGLPRSQVLEFFRKLEPCLVGPEAYARGHSRANSISLEVRMMPAGYVKASRQAQQDRRGSNLRGGHATDDGLGQDV
ncbi:hypothetical protein [Sinorhizobium medicae]|uniref:hypothetical protein n=1 Tax=Sinorhizobium medicae TaxID=110321 RepID=UPI0004628EFE|nr:hypothetical protein [Sinorhizobium medicae]TWA17534.1 hypothetical protein FB006_12248 [Sinorhizobium medicae]TWA33220.1 hypothetical protein FB009_12147 [Sinorhizobium medicae]TWA37465.1 hypothetical protein FB005_12150 [Sinorhizobium medicae]TWA46593.1 hypothetical protein FB008_12352 [Sinorhizobium medicae]UFX06396.1 hypothetical protein SmedWSM1115_29795 [Sinorhizobium medicae WSM1115]